MGSTKKKIKNVGQSPSSLHLDVAQRKLDVYINSTSPKPIILHKNTERQLETVNIIKKKKEEKLQTFFLRSNSFDFKYQCYCDEGSKFCI